MEAFEFYNLCYTLAGILHLQPGNISFVDLFSSALASPEVNDVFKSQIIVYLTEKSIHELYSPVKELSKHPKLSLDLRVDINKYLYEVHGHVEIYLSAIDILKKGLISDVPAAEIRFSLRTIQQVGGANDIDLVIQYIGHPSKLSNWALTALKCIGYRANSRYLNLTLGINSNDVKAYLASSVLTNYLDIKAEWGDYLEYECSLILPYANCDDANMRILALLAISAFPIRSDRKSRIVAAINSQNNPSEAEIFAYDIVKMSLNNKRRVI